MFRTQHSPDGEETIKDDPLFEAFEQLRGGVGTSGSFGHKCSPDNVLVREDWTVNAHTLQGSTRKVRLEPRGSHRNGIQKKPPRIGHMPHAATE